MGRDQRSAERQQAEWQPRTQGAKRGADVRRRESRFGGKQGGENEAEEEAAVDIGPRQHQQGPPKRRRALCVPGRDQHDGPANEERIADDMRACEQVRKTHRDGDGNGDSGRKGLKPAQQRRSQQRHCRGKTQAGGDHEACPSEAREQPGHEDLAQPLVRDPGRARHRMGEDIVVRHDAVHEDPAPDGEMGEDVGVLQECVARRHGQGKGDQPGCDCIQTAIEREGFHPDRHVPVSYHAVVAGRKKPPLLDSARSPAQPWHQRKGVGFPQSSPGREIQMKNIILALVIAVGLGGAMLVGAQTSYSQEQAPAGGGKK